MTWELVYILQEESYYSNQEEKMIGHYTHSQDNDNFPVWRAPTIKEKAAISNVHALITHEIMCSKDAKCNTKE